MRSSVFLVRNAVVFTTVLSVLSQACFVTASVPSSAAVVTSKLQHVLILSDIHADVAVQRTIGQSVQSLVERGAVDVIGLEGSEGPVALAIFQQFPNKKRLVAAADLLLARHKITGPIASALGSSVVWPPVYGVDSALHHAINVSAYVESVKEQPQLEDAVERRVRALNHFIPTLGAALRHFDALVERRHWSSTSLADFLNQARRYSPVGFSPILLRYVRAAALEAEFNVSEIQSQRQLYVRDVLSKMNERDRAAWMVQIAAGEDARLFEVGAEHHVRVDRYPALIGYAACAALTHGLQGSELLEAVQRWEDDTYAALVTTASEKEFVRCRREVRLVRQLIRFQLTPSDWKAYTSRASTRWSRQLPLSSFERFYAEADERSRLMVENLEAVAATSSASRALLVCGGFHQGMIARLLKEKGIRVTVTQPRLAKPSSLNENALALFMQEPNQLELFFSGRETMLSLPPFQPGSQDLAKMLLALGKDEKPAAALQRLDADFTIIPDASPAATGDDFLVVKGNAALPIYRALDTEGNAQDVEPRGPVRPVPPMHSTLKIDPAHPTDHAPIVVFEGDSAAIRKWFKNRQTKVDRKRASNFTLALKRVYETWGMLQNENLEFRIVSGGATSARVHDDVIELEEVLLDDVNLLEMELREECHHLLFIRMMVAASEDPMRADAQFVEELVTDRDKINFFLNLQAKDQYRVLSVLYRKFKNPHFAKVFIMSLPPSKRRNVIRALYNNRDISLTQSDELTQESVALSSNKQPAQANALLMSYYRAMKVPLPSLSITSWSALIYQHEQRFTQFLRSYTSLQPVALPGGGELIPFRRSVTPADKGGGSANDDFWRKKFKGKTAVIVEPHPDDGAISMGATIRKIIKAGGHVILVTVLPDYIGVTDDFARSGLGLPPGTPIKEAGLHHYKQQIRQLEARAYGRYIGISEANHWALNIELAHDLPRGPYTPIQFASLRERAQHDLSVGASAMNLQAQIHDIRQVVDALHMLVPGTQGETIDSNGELAALLTEISDGMGALSVSLEQNIKELAGVSVSSGNTRDTFGDLLRKALYQMLIAGQSSQLRTQIKKMLADVERIQILIARANKLSELGAETSFLSQQISDVGGMASVLLERLNNFRKDLVAWSAPDILANQSLGIRDSVQTLESKFRPDYWFLPYLTRTTNHHSHHEIVGVTFLEYLRECRTQANLAFYETYEHSGGFGPKENDANWIVAVSPSEMRDKRKGIQLYKSQMARRVYDRLVRDRNKMHAIVERAGDAYAERFILGKLVHESGPKASHGFHSTFSFLLPELMLGHVIYGNGCAFPLTLAAIVVGAGWYFYPVWGHWIKTVWKLWNNSQKPGFDSTPIQPNVAGNLSPGTAAPIGAFPSVAFYQQQA